MLIYPPFMALFQWSLSQSRKVRIHTLWHAPAFVNFPAIPPIKISGTEIKLSASLGIIMDSKLTFNAHVTALCKACYFNLESLKHIRHSLMDDMTRLIAVALVKSRLDYCHSLLFGVSSFNLDKLQHVQNLAARLTLNDWHSPIQHNLLKSIGSLFTHT